MPILHCTSASVKTLKKSIVQRLNAQMNAMKTPTSAWEGFTPDDRLNPKNVLVFPRRLSKHLSNRPSQVALDKHHRYVWIMSVRGEGSVSVDAGVHRLTPGKCVLIRPFQPHFYLDVTPQSICWLFITFEHEQNVKLDKINAHGANTLDPLTLGYVSDLLDAWNGKGEEAVWQVLFALILEKLAVQDSPTPAPSITETDINNLLVSKINKYGIENRHRQVAISELAKSLGMSPSYLRARFQTLTGRSLGKHLRDLKLNLACELLHDDKFHISEIAERCGYDSPFVFSRAFRNHFNATPTEFRNILKHHNPLIPESRISRKGMKIPAQGDH